MIENFDEWRMWVILTMLTYNLMYFILYSIRSTIKGFIHRALFGLGNKSEIEQRLLLKIDWFILSYCCLMVAFLLPFWTYHDLSQLTWQYFTNCGCFVQYIYIYFEWNQRFGSVQCIQCLRLWYERRAQREWRPIMFDLPYVSRCKEQISTR